MAGLLKTEAVVLRSMRYGEADRILHVYTPGRGRVSAIAKGVRRARSRFGGRLEPFFRLQIELHEGRGELLTVTGAQTVNGHSNLRGDAGALLCEAGVEGWVDVDEVDGCRSERLEDGEVVAEVDLAERVLGKRGIT